MTSMIQGSTIYSQGAAVVAGFGPLLIPIGAMLLLSFVVYLVVMSVVSPAAIRATAAQSARGNSASLGGRGGWSGGMSSVGRGKHSRGSSRAARSGAGSGSIYRTKATWTRPSQVVTSEAIVDALSKPSTMLKPLDYGGGPGAGPTKTA